MKKGILLIVIAILVAMILPTVTLLTTLASTPSAGWSNGLDLLALNDRAMRKSYPIEVLKLNDQKILSLHLDNTGLHANIINDDAKVVESHDFSLALDEIWLMRASLLHNQAAAIYYKSGKDLYYVQLDLDTMTISDPVMIDLMVNGIVTKQGYTLLYNDQATFLYRRNEAIAEVSIGAIKALEADLKDGVFHIVYSFSDEGSHAGRYIAYDIEKGTYTDPVELYNANDSAVFGTVRQVITGADGVGAVFSKTVIEKGESFGVIAGVFIKDGQVVLKEDFKQSYLQQTVTLQDADAESMSYIGSLASNKGVDFFRWTSASSLYAGKQLSNTRQSGILPSVFAMGDYQYFLWLDITANGKALRLASDNPTLISRSTQPGASEYLAIPAVLLFTGLLPLIVSFFAPISIFGIAMLFIFFFITQRKKGLDVSYTSLLAAFVAIYIIFLALIVHYSFLPQIQMLNLPAMYVKLPIVIVLLITFSAGMAIWVAFLQVEYRKHPVQWLAYVVMISNLLICVSFGLYRAIDIMKYKF